MAHRSRSAILPVNKYRRVSRGCLQTPASLAEKYVSCNFIQATLREATSKQQQQAHSCALWEERHRPKHCYILLIRSSSMVCIPVKALSVFSHFARALTP